MTRSTIHTRASRRHRPPPRLLLTFTLGRLMPTACDVIASDYLEQRRLERHLDLLLRVLAALDRERAA